jgi:HSP90 family molecular chaperone
MSNEASSLRITVDKSHILTLGERLYEQSIELIRELVNNAYDADATRVDVTVSGKEIMVADDGEGMDMEGLEQYFNVGSDEKLLHPISPRFGRDRIGQFGIGKFASLAAASRFEITTQKRDFAARAVFDKARWLEEGDSWVIPLTRLKPDPKRGDGTTVRLVELKRSFKPEDVTQRIAEGVPIRARTFTVYVNGYRVTPSTTSLKDGHCRCLVLGAHCLVHKA